MAHKKGHKKSHAGKGAAIGAGVSVAEVAREVRNLKKKMKKDPKVKAAVLQMRKKDPTFKKFFSKSGKLTRFGKGASVGTALAIGAAGGAMVGSFIKKKASLEFGWDKTAKIGDGQWLAKQKEKRIAFARKRWEAGKAVLPKFKKMFENEDDPKNETPITPKDEPIDLPDTPEVPTDKPTPDLPGIPEKPGKPTPDLPGIPSIPTPGAQPPTDSGVKEYWDKFREKLDLKGSQAKNKQYWQDKGDKWKEGEKNKLDYWKNKDFTKQSSIHTEPTVNKRVGTQPNPIELDTDIFEVSKPLLKDKK